MKKSKAMYYLFRYLLFDFLMRSLMFLNRELVWFIYCCYYCYCYIIPGAATMFSLLP